MGEDDYISLGAQFMRLCILNNLSDACHLLLSRGHRQGVVRHQFWRFDFNESLMIYTDKAFLVEDSDQNKNNPSPLTSVEDSGRQEIGYCSLKLLPTML